MYFIDREGENLNRKKLKIVSQTANEIIADIEHADNVTVEGTPINAAAMNSLKGTIDSANANATAALTKANEAYSKADEAAQGNGTVVRINGVISGELNYIANPQTQINNIINNTTKLTNESGGFAAGYNSSAIANNAVQLGTGVNNIENTMQYMNNKIADSDGQVYSKGVKTINRNDFTWKVIWTGSTTSGTAFNISSVFTTYPDATEILMVAGNGGTWCSSIMPLYKYSQDGIKERALTPNSSSLNNTNGTWNNVSIQPQDGIGNVYQLYLRFNSDNDINTTIQLHGVSNAALKAIFVR